MKHDYATPKTISWRLKHGRASVHREQLLPSPALVDVRSSSSISSPFRACIIPIHACRFWVERNQIPTVTQSELARLMLGRCFDKILYWFGSAFQVWFEEYRPGTIRMLSHQTMTDRDAVTDPCELIPFQFAFNICCGKILTWCILGMWILACQYAEAIYSSARYPQCVGPMERFTKSPLLGDNCQIGHRPKIFLGPGNIAILARIRCKQSNRDCYLNLKQELRPKITWTWLYPEHEVASTE
jgi:hypothetical protein